MIITKIMEELWKDISDKYKLEYDRCSNIDKHDLYKEICMDIKKLDKGLQSEDFVENIVATSGCSHRNKNGVHAGCAMCNWESKDVQIHAKLSALRDKDKELYAKVILNSFVQNRGINVKPAIIEEIATHDILDPVDFPEEVFLELFEKNKIFNSKPMYGLMAVRASNVSVDKLKKWKSQFRKSLLVGMGVEVGDEWLRNHWINKNTTNEEIINAINSIAEAKCFSTGDILIGIPGLSNGQSIEVFKHTCKWLDQINIDTILVSPLSRKERTVQDFIYKNLVDNEKLKDLHVVNGDLTGMPTLFVVFQAIYEVMVDIPNIEAKLKLSPQNFNNYFIQLDEYYRKIEKTELESYLYNKFKELVEYNLSSSGVNKKYIFEIMENIKTEKEYIEHLSKISVERSISIKDTLAEVSKEISKILWPNSWEIKVKEFEEELESYKQQVI